ncbi:hypothetical protein VM1G_10630 [Cytospora mali]|uniref:Uncharacterized protein n=1 Tax=Cytospora mali TaxID=578113 RepID=A0A194VIW1_CYTMA|nr:hypothetical protein VM1G_10630 [Valsa mali]
MPDSMHSHHPRPPIVHDEASRHNTFRSIFVSPPNLPPRPPIVQPNISHRSNDSLLSTEPPCWADTLPQITHDETRQHLESEEFYTAPNSFHPELDVSASQLHATATPAPDASSQPLQGIIGLHQPQVDLLPRLRIIVEQTPVTSRQPRPESVQSMKLFKLLGAVHSDADSEVDLGFPGARVV